MRKISFVLLLALGLISFAVSAQESASGILDKAVAKINKNSSAECKFTVKSGNQSLNGSLSVAGKSSSSPLLKARHGMTARVCGPPIHRPRKSHW